jgi:hypothetical protein
MRVRCCSVVFAQVRYKWGDPLMRAILIVSMLLLGSCSPCMRENILYGDCNWLENGG